MARDTKTLRLDPEVDKWLNKFSDEHGVNRSDVTNRALKVYASKLSTGQWTDPMFKDSVEKQFEDL